MFILGQYDFTRVCRCCGYLKEGRSMTAREEKRLVDRLCSELPPISDKGRQFLQTLEAFAGDKLVTVFATDLNSGFSRHYKFDVGYHAPKMVKRLALRLFSQCFLPGRVGSVVVCQFQGQRGESCPRNIYGYFLSHGNERLPAVRRLPPEEVKDACCRDFGGVGEVGATYC